MNIRQEVESAVAAFASAQGPAIPVAYEGVAFNKPTNSPYLQVVFLSNAITNATVDAQRQRVYGSFQIAVCVPDGKGMKQLDGLTSAIAALFPVYDKTKYSTFSVEQPANVSPPMTDAAFRVAVVRVQYRQELEGS
jgi:hypothetical protein